MVIKMLIVESIDENIVLLENFDTKEKIYENIENFNFQVHEGDVVIKVNDYYEKDETTTNKRIDLIKEKLERLKNI